MEERELNTQILLTLVLKRCGDTRKLRRLKLRQRPFQGRARRESLEGGVGGEGRTGGEDWAGA